MATGLSRGYEDPRWMTYKQAAENGWQVRKGEKGTHIEFWEVKAKPKEKNGEADRNGGDEAAKENQRRLIHRVYTVFNANQIDGVPPFEREQRSAFEAVHNGERILVNSGAKITHDQRDSAFYRPSTDSIHLPPKEAFKDAPGYYGTALHELAHWTGHTSRLNRPTLNDSYRFGDLNYAKEELRAELASVFIAAEVGVPHDPANHAAYVGSWIKALKEDKNEIFRAAHDASAATDFVLSLEREVSRAEALEIGNSAATDIEKTQVIRDETEALENDRDLVGSAESNLSTGGQESTRFVARFEPQTGTVAVHDKRLGADQHTPVGTLSELNGDSPAGGTSSTKAAEKTSPEGLSASFSAARSITAEKLGDAARTFTAQTQSGNYRGEIIGETDLHVVQRLSPHSAVAHMKHLLQPMPRVGDNVGIGYANELGSVKESRERSRTKELAR
jgi:antirestriction protein ArdC